MAWGVYFREWLDRQVIFVEDWPYAGMDFRGDPDMPLPAGEHWDDGGKTLDIFLIFIFCNVFFNFSGTCPDKRYDMQMWDPRDPLVWLRRYGERDKALGSWPWLLQ